MRLFSFFKKKITLPEPQFVIFEPQVIIQEPKMIFTFTNREEYFIYRADWKKRYFGIIAEIRASAILGKQAQREFSKTGKYDWSWNKTNPARIMWLDTHGSMESLRYKHVVLKKEASRLLEERHASKVKAGQQRAENISELNIT